MYSILLVDDESPVRHMIRASIVWEDYGFFVIDEAENGLEALELIQEKNPDVVITDIKMPYMDGIALIRELRKTHPTTTVIILSGYDEFSYAQNAVQLGVSYYALKPLSKDDFIDLLKKIKTHLDEKIENLTNRKKLEEVYNNAIPNLMQQLLAELYTGHTDGVMGKAASYNLPCDQDFYMTAVIETSGDDATLDLATVDQILDSYPAYEKFFFHTIFKNNNILTFYHKVKKDRQLEESLFIKSTLNKIDDIKKYISFYTKRECNIGVSRPVYKFTNLAEARRQSICALNYKPYYPYYSIYYIGDLETEDLTILSTQTMDDAVEKLVSEIKLGSCAGVEKSVDELFDKKTGLNPAQTQNSLFKVMTILTNLALGYDIDIANLEGAGQSFASTLSDISTIRTISTRLKKLCCSLNREVKKKRTISSKKFVEEAKKLIEINYKNPAFSLDGISSDLGVSEAYFSSTFKKETGVAFVKALNRARIEHAKALLKSKQLKTYEIADLVGFTDPNYFSFCFKKLEGISPQKYKKTIADL
ncbi:MAG: response regulator [Treponema sp.]|nr:response regulator [Treponema sp.]